MTSIASSTRANAVVVDASALIEFIKNGAAAAAIGERLFERRLLLYAPAIIDLEVLNALRRFVLFEEMKLADAEAALHAYPSIPIVRFAHDHLYHRIWQLRGNFTAYDAAYVALAEGMEIPLITLDARLAKAAPPTIRVELF